MIHFTFDGWTFRQNDSFLGITAYFMNTNWEHRTVFLELPFLLNRYINNAITDEIAAILRFFDIKNR
jgi:hypothetical protein